MRERLKTIKLPWMLLILTGVAFIVRVWNLYFNSIFVDEAAYVLLGQKILSGNLEEGIEAFTWVGGLPFFYPVITGGLYTVGGILLSRFFNAVLGVLSVLLFYQFVIELPLVSVLLRRHVAIISAFIFATAAIPILASRMANYDILCFVFFLASLVFLTRTYFEKGRWGFWAAMALLVSVFAKYISVIYVPFLFLIVIILAAKHKKEKVRIGLIKEFCFPLLIGLAGYLLYTFSDVSQFYTGNAVSTAAPLTVIEAYLKPSGPIFIVALLGVVFLWSRKTWMRLSLFLVAALLPLLFHLVGRNSDTATQHSFLGLIFITPFVGTLLAPLLAKIGRFSYAALLCIVALNYLTSLPVRSESEHFWPNSDKSASFLREHINPEHKLLAEGGDIYTLALAGRLPESQISGPFVFEYEGQTGLTAYLAALDAAQFQFVELEGTYFSSEDLSQLRDRLANRYEEVLSDGEIKIYQLKP